MNTSALLDPPRTRAAAGPVVAALAEAPLVRLGLGVVALHVVDDNFLQPEPGVSPADHLISGLVPLALVAAAALAHSGLRPGLRAAFTLLAGFFGVVTGTEAAYYTLNGGPSGDDFTGIMATLAGVMLLVVGTVTLWRSRRTGGHPWRRRLRRAAVATGALALTGFVLFPTALAYVSTHVARAEVPSPSLGAAHEAVVFTTSDGLQLHGWYVPSRNGATVIVFAGRTQTQQHARMLVSHGYGVLLFDRRGEGASDGDPNMLGWNGDRDLHAAAAYLTTRPEVDPERLGALGLSVGGEMLIRAAAHSDAFKATVSEGGSGQSVRDDLANGKTLSPLLGGGVHTLALALFANTLPPKSLTSEVAEIAPHAVFFVYGENGQGGTEEAPNTRFYAAANKPKRLWEIPDGQHIAGITTAPADYERRIVGFFDEALIQRSPIEKRTR
jgi:uncharacterized protein